MQLVELQESIRSSQMAAFAISYDPVDVLAAFAGAHDISYPLLSDVGSKLIEEVGLLHQDIEAERAYWGRETEERHRRLPYPATFVLDERGIVVEKVMERSHRNRPTGRMLLEKLGAVPGQPEALASAEADGVAVTAWAPSATYFPNQIFQVGVRVVVAEGLHLYVPPTPDSYVHLDVSIDAPAGVYWEPADLPAGRPFRISGLDDEFWVVEDTIQLAVPVHIHEDVGDVVLGPIVRFQACSSEACLIPDTLRLELPLRSRGKL